LEQYLTLSGLSWPTFHFGLRRTYRHGHKK